MASVGEIVGNINPREVIQENTRACLPAAFLAELDPNLGIAESDIVDLMTDDGLFIPGELGGTGLYPASTLSHTTEKLRLPITAVFDARLASSSEPQNLDRRITEVDNALRRGEHVILAYPKRREGKEPFSHYSTVTGYESHPDGTLITIMDPSDVDGGVRHVDIEGFLPYITPTEEIPVMAWGVRYGDAVQEEVESQFDATELPGLSLLANPLSKESDTGLAVPPNTKHPSSVVMPTSEITKQFNALGDIVLSRDGKLPIGYPRFVIPATVKDLSHKVHGTLSSLPFATMESAEAAANYIQRYGRHEEDAVIHEADGLYWLHDSDEALEAWQHTGLGLSSRQALATLEGRGQNDLERRTVAENSIKQTIEHYTGAKQEDIYLFPTGMAAIYALNQAMIVASDQAPGVQFGFPYTDTFEQRKFGPGMNISKNILDMRDGDYDTLAGVLESNQPIRGVITECPGNPKLWTPDFHKLDAMLDGRAPLVIDDTIGTMFNIDDNKLPDSVVARVTSLTKFFSSVGDVMGGSIVLRPDSPHYELVKAALDSTYQDTLWYEDAEALVKNSTYFPEIMPIINENGEQIAKWLHDEWTGEDNALEAVYHPSLTGTEAYDAVKKDEGGYGGLMSLKFNDPERAYRFFDALNITKGPSLGTFYSIACLYTWLAHKPVGSVGKFGVVPDFVRISFGIESFEDLQERIREAFVASA